MSILSVKDLNICFHAHGGKVHAVNNVSFNLGKGEILGIVGESGSGKSTLSHAILGLLPSHSNKTEDGVIDFLGTNLLNTKENNMRCIRGSDISIIFQDPMSSLNPYLRIVDQLVEPLLIHRRTTVKKELPNLIQALAEVGIPDPHKRIYDYPHQFSGGMLQRIMIAMALITKPKILIADEPTTALDVIVQKQIIDLIRSKCKDLDTAVIFISHDLSVVSYICDRVLVMYSGCMLEEISSKDLLKYSYHPYTQALRKSMPTLKGKQDRLYSIPGKQVVANNDVVGCPFASRCEGYIKECSQYPVVLKEIHKGCKTACIRYQMNPEMEKL